MLHESLQQGQVRHRRHQPRGHAFSYATCLSLLDLDELPRVFARSRWWSLERFNLVSFRRRDYLDGADGNLKQAVLEKAGLPEGERATSRVMFLGHLRQFGYCFNPVSFYFVYHGQRLRRILAEITNTPWGERHCYTLRVPGERALQPVQEFHFDKQFHVSPFLPMDMQYRWRFRLEEDRLAVFMAVRRDGQQVFDATLHTQAQALTTRTMNRMPWRYLAITWRTSWRIYWQALRLWLKRTPFFAHPDAGKTANLTETDSTHAQR